MFGFSPWAILAGLAGYVLAAALGWAALHEYGVAAKQAAHDRAAVGVATARAADVARSMQQAADNKQIAELHAIASRAQAAYTVQQQLTASAARQLVAANLRLEQLTAASPATACIRAPVPASVRAALVWHP